MYKKKLSTIAIITILTLSIFIAAIPMAHALTDDVSVTGSPGHVGDEVTVSGTGATGFAPLEVYWDSLATKIKDGYALGDGTYSITKVKIPEGIAGDHNVIVKDTLSDDVKFTTFEILPEIELSTTKGLPGDSVIVTGTGFGGTTFVSEVDVSIYLGAITTAAPEDLAVAPGVSVTGSLDYSPVVILTVDLDCDVTITGLVGGLAIVGATVTDIQVTDDGKGHLTGEALAVVVTDDPIPTKTGLVDVAITGTINYATGAITLTASGTESVGSTDPVTDIVVTIDVCDNAIYNYAEYEVTPSAGVTTDALGSFSAAIIIPAIAEIDYDPYVVTAIDTDGNSDTATLTVDYYITLTPASGPTGITITMAGRIKADTDYELRFSAATVATGTSDADGSFSDTYLIPLVLSTGNYDVTVVWEITKSRTATFTVSPTPTLTKIDPASGVPGAVVTISGKDFCASANITAYIGTTIVNSTELDDRFGPTGPWYYNPGIFTDLEFTVPDITPGLYILTVTDEFGASTGTAHTFTVKAPPVTTVTLNAASYFQGDTLSFTIVTTESSFTTGPTVTVRDPTGSIWWTDTWTLTPGIVTQSVLYQDQVTGTAMNPLALPADAPLGSWNWTITYTPVSTAPVLTKATGLFTVAAPPTMQTVLDQLDALEATITGVVTDSEGDLTALINTKTGTITTKLDPLMPKLQGIEDTAVIIATMLGEVQVDIAALDLDALGVDITAIKGDVATIKTNIGTVDIAVDTLDAVVGAVAGQLVEVQTTLGTLEGTVTAIDGNVATIDTEVGTLQADVTDILDKPSVDMTPAWIAVVLSLIAAIAAIFAVITIRQKIAG